MPRNSGGTYSLPAGNPVSSGTPVSSVWANNTLTDLKTEMTDSLSRSGKGGMSAALGLFAGTQAIPGLGFTDDTDNGLYYKGADNFALVVGALELLDFSTNMVKFSGTAPIFRFNESDAAADNKLWDVIASGEELKFRALTDALAATDWLTVTRTGGTVDSIALAATSVSIPGLTGFVTAGANTTFTGANTFTGTNTFSSTSPLILFTETDAAANNGKWRVIASGEEFLLQLMNDALDSAANAIGIARTNNTVDAITLGGNTTISGGLVATNVDVSNSAGASVFNDIVINRGGGAGLATVGRNAWIQLWNTTDAKGSGIQTYDGGTIFWGYSGGWVERGRFQAGGALELVGALELGHASDTTIARIAAGRASIEGLEIGYRGLPSASVTTGAVVAADAGKCVNATGGVTIPNSTFAAGDVLVIDNQSGGAITITASITTLTLAGTTSTGNRTLANNGFATVKFRSSTSALISGTGLT